MKKSFLTVIAILLIFGLWFLYFFKFLFFDRIGEFVLGPSVVNKSAAKPVEMANFTDSKTDKAEEPIIPIKYTYSIKELSEHLILSDDDDYQKAKKIYTWISKNISYDDEAYNKNESSNVKPEDVLKNKMAVCEGFSRLFTALAQKAGLNAETLIGYDHGFDMSLIPSKATHAWNRVKVDKRWVLLDVTWGSGFGEKKFGKLKTQKLFSKLWFDVNPESFVLTHLPVDSQNNGVLIDIQNVKIPIVSIKEFYQLPKINSAATFLGFKGDSIRSLATRDNKIKLVEVYNTNIEDIKVVSAPYVYLLNKNQIYTIELASNTYKKVILNNAGSQKNFIQKNSTFFFSGALKAGTLKIGLAKEANDTKFEVLLMYEVK